MAIVPNVPASKVNLYKLNIDKFIRGTNTLINQARLPKEYAVESTNLWQVQDGVWKTRPGTKYYGAAITGVTTIDGAEEFETTDGSREVIAVAGGKVWKSVDGGAWSELTGATFTSGLRPFFRQINNRLYITNGTDDLAFYDGTNLSKYSAILAPTNLAASQTGLTGTNYTNYYRVVAVNTIGYTTPSDGDTVQTVKHRDEWAGDTEYVSLSWDAVDGATAYQIYWGEFDGEEYLIGETVGVSFTDKGQVSFPANIYVETPDDNTTSAPKFRVMEISGNRLWATYDPDNPWRVYYTGTGQYFVNPAFSPFYGGGYSDLEIGTKNKPVNVVHYRTGKGDPVITALCSSPDGQGTIFQIELVSITVGDVTFTVPAASKIVGSIGADAPYGVVKVGDNVLFPNKKGVYALRNKEQIFNVLSSDDLTGNIRNSYESLNPNKIPDLCAYHRPPRVYFSGAVGSDNDRVFIYDMERRNWTWAWNIGFKQFFEYTDNSTAKITHFLAIPTSGNQLVEISENFLGDFGESFLQTYLSPLIRVNEDYTTVAKINEAIFELGNLRGVVSVQVIGITKSGQISTLSTKTVSANTGTSGWGDDAWSGMLFSDTEDVPSTFAESSTKKKLRVGKKLYAVQFKVTANNIDTSFELLGLQAKGYLLPSRAPSQWN